MEKFLEDVTFVHDWCVDDENKQINEIRNHDAPDTLKRIDKSLEDIKSKLLDLKDQNLGEPFTTEWATNYLKELGFCEMNGYLSNSRFIIQINFDSSYSELAFYEHNMGGALLIARKNMFPKTRLDFIIILKRLLRRD